MSVILLFVGPIFGGIVWAYAVKEMLPRLRSLALAYLVGAAASWLVPFGLIRPMASGANNSNGAASLLHFSAFVSAFLALMAFVMVFAAITTEGN